MKRASVQQQAKNEAHLSSRFNSIRKTKYQNVTSRDGGWQITQTKLSITTISATDSLHSPLKDLLLTMTLAPAPQLIGWLINQRPLHLWHINSKWFRRKSDRAQRHLTEEIQLVIESHHHMLIFTWSWGGWKNIYWA